MNEVVEVLEFSIIPVHERFYSEESSWGIFNFTTKDSIPHFNEYRDPFSDEKDIQKMSSLVGKMQRLYVGSEYKVRATCEWNNKYSSYQYVPFSVTAIMPKTTESQELFLKTLTTEYVAKSILQEYPNVVEEVMNGQHTSLDYDKIKGIGEKTWCKIRASIIDNYVISDILTMLQPLGVTYSMIKKLLNEESNPALLKEELEKNPYIMTKIRGLGFKRVDDLALKLKPELKCSQFRLVAFVNFFLKDIGDNEGHTWVTKDVLFAKVSDSVPECMKLLPGVLKNNSFLYERDGKVGLRIYRELEQKIYEILIEKRNFTNEKYQFTQEEIELAICQAEDEQGFIYTPEQREIIFSAVENDLSIISGKAGTGKTTIKKAIYQIYRNRNFTITACALSAKAAQRITETTGAPASTIHRMLGAEGFNKFHFNNDNPIPTDVIDLDEASMVNARLFYDLLIAVNIGTRIIISGDHMQLPPIGYGNIFSDMLYRADVFNSKQLTKPMRQAELSGILSDANLIREGINPIQSPDLKIVHGELNDMFYMFRENREALRNIAVKTYLSSIANEGLDEVVIAVPRRKECINSASEINKIIQENLLSNVTEFIDKGYIKYYLGAKVMQIVNNYEKNTFNGEIGYITKIGERDSSKKKPFCEITFKDANGRPKMIEYEKNELDQIDLAYAMTVHKLQGSGYKTVIGIIDNTHYTLLDNCMLYTLLTRAKSRCLLLAEPNAFIKCIQTNHNTKRQTWLKEIA